PDFISPISKDSVLDQVSRYLKFSSDLDVLDLRPALLEAKKTYQIYDGLDTHWSQVGAFVAVQQIQQKIKAWFPEIEVESLADYFFENVAIDGDLAVLMGLRNRMKRYTARLVSSKPGPTLHTQEEDPLARFHGFTRSPALPVNHKALIFHDSFGLVMQQFLAPTFNENLFFWEDYLDYRRIDEEQPDIVIQEVGQRSLLARLIRNPMGIPKPVVEHKPPKN
ncbi:MAG: hypothetical protein KJ645_04210, partial [Planctomycetes bacterium]|nr:hypothetical protein [Planctomycetota bacterium]